LIISKNDSDQIIYVHPDHFRMFYRATIPISLPALIKRIPYPVRGYYPEELTTEIIRSAAIAIIDIHWHYALHGAKKLVSELKACNPQIVVIAGGYTASMFPEKLIQDFAIDFIIRGDAEIPLAALVESIMQDAVMLETIPNLVGKEGFQTNWDYRLSKADLDKNDFFDLDFFPAYKADVRKIHRRNIGWPAYVYPYLMAFRGCPINCPTCAGSTGEQKKLFKRGAVIRSAGRLAEDLQRLNHNQDIRYVNIIHDFFSLMPESYTEEVLRSKTALNVLIEFTDAPSGDVLQKIFSGFKGGVLYFSADKMHTQTDNYIDPQQLIQRIRQVKNTKDFYPVLYYNRLYFSNPEYRKAVEAVRKECRILVSDVADWWEDFPRPDENGKADVDTFQAFFDYSTPVNTSRSKRTINRISQLIYVLAGKLLPHRLLMKLKVLYMKLLQPYHK
jgi:hypothetical protein